MFPHIYKDQVGKNYYSLRESPYGNTFTMDFARQLLLSEQLGKSGQADMLCISLSSTDFMGHKTGPNSLELQDTYLRVDKDINHSSTSWINMLGLGNIFFF